MKKIIACLISALLIVTVFAGCGSNNTGNYDNGTMPTQTPSVGNGYVNDRDGIIEPDDNGTVGDGTGNDTGILGNDTTVGDGAATGNGSTIGNGTTTGNANGSMGNGSAGGSSTAGTGSSAGTGASSTK